MHEAKPERGLMYLFVECVCVRICGSVSRPTMISAQRTFYCSRRTASETSNGTHTLHSKSQNSLRAASYDTHTHHSKKKPSRPKTNTILESITAKNINSGAGERGGEGGGRCRLCGVMAPPSPHLLQPFSLIQRATPTSPFVSQTGSA